MAKKNEIDRIIPLIELLMIKSRRYSGDEIMSRIYNNESKRTFERDRQFLRDRFVDIKYDKQGDYYYLAEETNFEKLDKYLSILIRFQAANILIDNFKDTSKLLDFILPSSDVQLKGIEHLELLIRAINNKQKIRFVHQSFENDNQTEYNIAPYLLKEYQDRWYIVGFVEAINEYRTFGIDRIETPEILPDKFIPKPNNKIKENFESIIGLNYSGGSCETVELQFTAKQGKYIKTHPLHTSQTIVSDTKEFLTIRIFVIPNLELSQKILSFGSAVKVMKPVSLRNDIFQQLTLNIKNYER